MSPSPPSFDMDVRLPDAIAIRYGRTADRRRERAEALRRLAGDDEWEARRVPVLAALAPVMTSTEGEITYPGDPMCLYAALSVAVRSAAGARERGIDPSAPYPDLCPDWGPPPAKPYRLAAADSGIRPPPDGQHCSDQCVFDPRVWDEGTRADFRAVLSAVRPRIMLISSVSPGHRYALQMAGIVRDTVPECLVVLGGRHADETVRFDAGRGEVALGDSSTARTIHDGRVPAVVDFVVAGDGYFALDLLLRAITGAMDLTGRTASVGDVADVLAELRDECDPPGTAVILALRPGRVQAFPIRGGGYDLADLPSPYQAFAIRSRFPVFDAGGSDRPGRTAHVTVSNACPYHCNFCSESAALAGGLKRFRNDPVTAGVGRLCEYASYGAESAFFDDSVFWSGAFPRIAAFCDELERVRRDAAAGRVDEGYARWLADPDDLERMAGMQWGAQFTADILTTLHAPEKVFDVLRAMRRAGCSYVYLGIESMSEAVMVGVHKNLRRTAEMPWKVKVRTALERIRESGIDVGSSVLFGLEGETRETIDETIEEVGLLVDDGLLTLASPNILTYHPATPLTHLHDMAGRLDYHSPEIDNRPPYTYFEEAFPGVVSKNLSEDDIWHIHRTAGLRWGATRNDLGPQHLSGSAVTGP